MTDLISVLVLTWLVKGELHESEHAMAHGRCMLAQAVLTRAIGAREAPPVEMLDGTRVPLASATCVPGCFADALAPEWILQPLRASDDRLAAEG